MATISEPPRPPTTPQFPKIPRIRGHLSATAPQLPGPASESAEGASESAEDTTDSDDPTSSGADSAETTSDEGETTGDSEGGESPDCSNLNPLPLEFVAVAGAMATEDYVFDANGYLLSLSNQSLFRSAYGEAAQLAVPGVASTQTAGTGMLPNGDIVFNDVNNGRVMRLTPEGESTTLLAGLAYPNGLAVHENGWVYVALDDGEAVIRFDPDNPVSEVVVQTGNPNGLAFGADYRRLYIGSYDEGGVKVFDLDTQELTVLNDDIPWVDGVVVDVCDNVYVTTYAATGTVWRIAADQTTALVAQLPADWIPNLNFGSGFGGWEHDRIYVSEFGENRVFELAPGTWGIDQPQL